MKKYKKKIIISGVLCIFLYIILGAILPFVNTPQISNEITLELSSSQNTGNERARIIEDNGEALQQRIRLISQAKETIRMSTYEFRSDESGKDLLASLIDAAHRGVDVKVIVDGVGELTRMKNNDYFIALSSLENAQIKIYNPIHLGKPWNLNARMHDKYLMIDDKAYVLGGRNSYDYFLGQHNGYKNYDWDVLVYQEHESESSSLEELKEYFGSVWKLPVSKLYEDDAKKQKNEKVRQVTHELNQRYQKLQQQKWFRPVDYKSITLPTKDIDIISNPIHCSIKEPIVFHTITEYMLQANKEVVFHTPYIIADKYMMERIEKVCKKVPKVMMMTNSVANNGNPFGAMDYQKNKEKILKTGLNILEYDGGISYHGKCLTIDDHISMIGSFNFDMRSTYINTEIMVAIDSQEVNASLKEKMKIYEKDALVVQDKDTYRLKENQVIQEMSVMRKIQLFFLQFFLGWLRFLM